MPKTAILDNAVEKNMPVESETRTYHGRVGSGRGGARRGRAGQSGAGQDGTPTSRFAQNTNNRPSSPHKATRALKKFVLNIFSESRTSEILCKPNGGTH